jgi:hypothetical protein
MHCGRVGTLLVLEWYVYITYVSLRFLHLAPLPFFHVYITTPLFSVPYSFLSCLLMISHAGSSTRLNDGRERPIPKNHTTLPLCKIKTRRPELEEPRAGRMEYQIANWLTCAER